MSLLTQNNLFTRIYPQTIEEIKREDENVVPLAIDSAESEAKSYLSRFDLEKLFDIGADGYVEDLNLKSKLVDMACWNLVALSNVNLNADLLRVRYEDAIDWLKMVQSGKCDPPGWPYKDDDDDTITGNSVQLISNTKRTQHY